MTKLILASASPRRHEILANALIAHTVFPVDADESIPAGADARSVPQIIAERKARAADALLKDAPEKHVILAADTVVICGNEIFGKPADRADAIRMISALSGACHTVASGICVTDGVSYVSDTVCTDVYMREISEAQIESYVDRCEPYDKAGAYGIQEAAGAFVRRIDGDYSGVVGLPLCRTVELLAHFGISMF